MAFEVESRHLGEVVVLVPKAFADQRGYFMETYREDQFLELGLPGSFVQDNHSCSRKGVVRGLHFQWEPPMGKLMRVTRGAAFLVAVDLRLGSPTLGKWVGIEVYSRKPETSLGAGKFCAGILRTHRMKWKFNTNAPEYTTEKRNRRFDGTTRGLGSSGRFEE